MTTVVPLFEKLELRRKELGISQANLAAKSGVSLPTVHRILTGHARAASVENAMAIAQALGMDLQAVPRIKLKEVLEQQARQKAERLIAMVQGTSALESQGLPPDQLARMVEKTTQELLAGSRHRLWAE